MASLLVRNVGDEIVKALKTRATQTGISAEAEHRNLLADALLTPGRRSFEEVIQSIPSVGRDDDFSRMEDVSPSSEITWRRHRQRISTKSKFNRYVQAFLSKTTKYNRIIDPSVMAIGELRLGFELNRDHGDHVQVNLLEAWLGEVAIG